MRNTGQPAGERNQQVIVQKGRTVVAGNGQPTTTFSDEYTHWAKVVSVSGTEGQQGYNQIAADTTHLVEMLYDEKTREISPVDQIVWKGKLLQILSALDPDGLSKKIVIQANHRVKGFNSSP